MRIVVVGTSGAGKTTLARRIAALLELPHIELDAINWQPGWRDLTRHPPYSWVAGTMIRSPGRMSAGQIARDRSSSVPK
jgi:ABC-type branched-subunit amino acid transport system ATPase component